MADTADQRTVFHVGSMDPDRVMRKIGTVKAHTAKGAFKKAKRKWPKAVHLEVAVVNIYR